MNQHILTGQELSTGRRRPSAIVAEYEMKSAALEGEFATFEAAGSGLRMAASIGGAYGGTSICTGRVTLRELQASLLKSAWRHVWQLYGLEDIASADTKRRVHQMFEAPPPFTVDNIREQFGELVSDPWGSILKGLAEVFSGLDPVYRSHEKMKIGIKGLPKRIIIGGVGGWTGRTFASTYGINKARDVLNALAAYQGKPLITQAELDLLTDDRNEVRPLENGGTFPHPHRSRYHTEEMITVIGRGVWIKRFANGNGHMFFSPDTLRDVNKALSEYYGEVLPDCPEAEDRPTQKRRGTEVCKDLQYYPTPVKVVTELLRDVDWTGMRVLEPSCGCGRIMDGLKALGAFPHGVEVDAERAAIAASRGHDVLRWNFLDLEVNRSTGWGNFDAVVMNPPFYGKHYEQHIRHALDFVRPGGVLLAILPSTARYDHGLLDDHGVKWRDLPTGSFTESGTNVSTSIARIDIPGPARRQ